MEKYCGVGKATDVNIIGRMLFACCLPKATDTSSEYVILIAFPRQQWLRERASMLRYTYIACIVNIAVIVQQFGKKKRFQELEGKDCSE